MKCFERLVDGKNHSKKRWNCRRFLREKKIISNGNLWIVMKYYFSSNFLIPTVTSILNYFIIQQIKFTIFKALSKLIAIQLLNRHPRCNKLVALWVDSHGHEFQFQLSKCLPFLSKCKNTFYANSYKRANLRRMKKCFAAFCEIPVISSFRVYRF